MRKPRKASGLRVKLEDGRPLLDVHQIRMLARLETCVSMQTGEPESQCGAFTGSGFVSGTRRV